MKGLRRMSGLLLLGLVFPVLEAQGGWAVLNHNTDSILLATGKCIVAPTTQENRLRIHRIRLTRSGTADVTHRFTFKVTEDTAGDSESLSTCDLPDCRHVLTVEGTKQSRVYDLDGLNLLLPPGARLYVSEDAHQASEHATIEVMYTES